MTRRVVEKLCTKEVCVDFLATNLRRLRSSRLSQNCLIDRGSPRVSDYGLKGRLQESATTV